jgi:spermidine/putrescine transport system substrate-binding protein
VLRAAGAASLVAPLLRRPGQAAAAGVVKVTAYDGFIPPAFKQQFEADTGIEVQVRLVDSQAPELNLLVAERPHPLSDICTVTGNRIHQFVEAAVIEPLDVERLKSWGRIDPLYAEAAWNSVNGARVGVPLVMGAEVLVYNTGKVVPPPDSWGAMFDTRFKGKTAYVIEDFLQCTMLYQGADGTFASYVGNPEAAAHAVDAARDTLIRNKGQVVKYYEDGSELQQLLLDEEVWLAQAYAGSLTRLILAGQPIRFVIPREGSLGFVYNFSVVQGAPNRDNAYRFLDALLAWPSIGPELSRSAGYTSTFIGAEAGLIEAEKAAFVLTQDQLKRIHFLSYQGQALSSKLIDRAVQEVQAA